MANQMNITAVRLAFLGMITTGCQGTTMQIFSRNHSPTSVYDPPAMQTPQLQKSAVVFGTPTQVQNPIESSLLLEWQRLWENMGYSPAEARAKAEQMVRIK